MNWPCIAIWVTCKLPCFLALLRFLSLALCPQFGWVLPFLIHFLFLRPAPWFFAPFLFLLLPPLKRNGVARVTDLRLHVQVFGHEHPQDLVQIADPSEVQGGGIVSHFVPGLGRNVIRIFFPWLTCLGERDRYEVKDWNPSPFEWNVVILNTRGNPCSILSMESGQLSSHQDNYEVTLKIVFPETLLVDLLKFLSIATSRSYQSPIATII